jgi:hypothetical protein
MSDSDEHVVVEPLRSSEASDEVRSTARNHPIHTATKWPRRCVDAPEPAAGGLPSPQHFARRWGVALERRARALDETVGLVAVEHHADTVDHGDRQLDEELLVGRRG